MTQNNPPTHLLLPQNRQPPPLPPRRLHHAVVLYRPLHPRRHRHHVNLPVLPALPLRSLVLQLRQQRLAVPTPAYAVLLPKVEPIQPPRRQRPVRERGLPDRVIVVDEAADQGVCRFDAVWFTRQLPFSPGKGERGGSTYYRYAEHWCVCHTKSMSSVGTMMAPGTMVLPLPSSPRGGALRLRRCRNLA